MTNLFIFSAIKKLRKIVSTLPPGSYAHQRLTSAIAGLVEADEAIERETKPRTAA